MVGAFRKPSSGRRDEPIHSISKQYSIQTLERVYKHYYFIIRGGGNVQLSSKIAVVCAVIREVALESIFISGENLSWERVRTGPFLTHKKTAVHRLSARQSCQIGSSVAVAAVLAYQPVLAQALGLFPAAAHTAEQPPFQ